MTPTSLVAYLSLFAASGLLFLFASLLLGWLLRARAPSAAKLEPYECGEPPVGSSFVQFDLRFYVVALVFLIFEVEVALFFPWAAVFGKTTQLMGLSAAQQSAPQAAGIQEAIAAKYRELGVSSSGPGTPQAELAGARHLGLAAMADLAAFFAVLLVGFAYVWYQGDLNWVRAVGRRAAVPVASRAGASGEKRGG
jgi:NADH-quinone oxidoreductase subunit A